MLRVNGLYGHMQRNNAKAAILIATLLGLDQVFRYTLDAVLFGCGLAVMVSFLRSAQRVEPFFARD